jgi:aspartate kinase
VSFEVRLEMAASGAKVLQLRSVEFARNHGVRLHVRSSFSEADGTWVLEEDERMLEKAIISGVTHTVEEAIYRVEGARASELFGALADAGASVDTIIQTGPEIVFSAPFSDAREVTETLETLGVRWSSRDDLGKVSLVGAGMRTHPGIAGKTFATLAGIGIEPQVVNTSPIKIACFVARDDVERAVKALHDAFELHTEEAMRAHD